MLKKNLFFVFLCLAVTISACKKSKDNPDPFNANFNGASVEENKATLEDNGIQLVDEFDQMKDVKAIKVIANLGDLSVSNSSFKSAKVQEALAPIKPLASVKDSKGMKNVLKAAILDDPESLAADWDSIVGRYTYNSATEEFEKTALSNEVIIEFPGLKTDVTNTAQITIHNFSVVTLVDPVIDFGEGVTPQLPTSLNMELSYNNVVISTYIYTASFESNGIPLSISSTISIGEFSFSATLTHSPDKNASITYSLKRNDQKLIETHVEANGDWSKDNIDANSDGYFETIINNANTYIQVMNIKVAGEVDFSKLAPALRTIQKNKLLTDQKRAEQIAAAINDNAKLVVVTVDKNEKISEAEAYAFKDEYDEWQVDLRFVFGDGSKVDAETYFNEGFNGLVDAINNLIAEINAENDINIDPVEY
jgi:hypothetical protein